MHLLWNRITDISPLFGLTTLETLHLLGNKITDISPLSSLTNLKELDLRWNLLNDSSIDDYIPALATRGVTVLFTPFREGDFDIELVFVGTFTEDQKNVLRLVARRWESIITEDLPDYVLTQGWSGGCGDQSYQISAGNRIDDLRIYVATFDGSNTSVVGRGAPRLLREETRLPVVGCMAFDLKAAYLPITGLHEIAHVLGFGTIWDDLGFYQNPPDGDEHFNGPLATTAFDDAGGRNYPGAKVPLADPAHWSGDVFGQGELMLPWGGGALSAITAQSLADLGYGVDVSQADPYTLPGATTGAKIAIAPPRDQGFGVNGSRPDLFAKSGVAPRWQGKIAEGLPSIVGDDRRGRLESAERVWGAGITFDLARNHQVRDPGPTAHTAPELTCGAGLMNDPIYVVDPQGRIVRTISRTVPLQAPSSNWR